MLNTEEFAKRLQIIIDHYGESASSFAEKIGVQRSSISHILSGRNKPSLEFVLKILAIFPEVEFYWLLNGTGHFPKQAETPIPPNTSTKDLFSEAEAILPLSEDEDKMPQEAPSNTTPSKDKVIERIVIFYTDGSFKNFEN